MIDSRSKIGGIKPSFLMDKKERGCIRYTEKTITVTYAEGYPYVYKGDLNSYI